MNESTKNWRNPLLTTEEKPYYCCICFKALSFEDCHIIPDGDREDVCNECAANEEGTH